MGFRQIISGKDIGGTTFNLPNAGETVHQNNSPKTSKKQNDQLKLLQNAVSNSKGFTMQSGNYNVSPQPVRNDHFNLKNQMTNSRAAKHNSMDTSGMENQ